MHYFFLYVGLNHINYFIHMKKVFGGFKKKATKEVVKKEKDILKMSKKELAAKKKELAQDRGNKKLSRVKDVVPAQKSGKGCFVRNVMHKRANGARIIFNVGDKLDPKDNDYSILKKHLA